jgi:outer membrane immunogenic protein
MKKVLLIAAALAMMAMPARAADFLVKAPPRTPIPAWSWTGFYVGGNFGGAWATSDWFEDFTGDPVGFQDASISSASFIGGGQIGYDYRGGWAVFGIQADADLASLVGTVSGTGQNCFAEVGDFQSCTTHIKSIGTVTGRIGAAFDRTGTLGRRATLHRRSSRPHQRGQSRHQLSVPLNTVAREIRPST